MVLDSLRKIELDGGQLKTAVLVAFKTAAEKSTIVSQEIAARTLHSLLTPLIRDGYHCPTEETISSTIQSLFDQGYIEEQRSAEAEIYRGHGDAPPRLALTQSGRDYLERSDISFIITP